MWLLLCGFIYSFQIRNVNDSALCYSTYMLLFYVYMTESKTCDYECTYKLIAIIARTVHGP